jgi:hypothetical protein
MDVYLGVLKKVCAPEGGWIIFPFSLSMLMAVEYLKRIYLYRAVGQFVEWPPAPRAYEMQHAK